MSQLLHCNRSIHLNSFLGILVQCCALGLKNFHIGLEQIFPLHTFFPWHGAYQYGHIKVFECDIFFVSCNHLYMQRKRPPIIFEGCICGKFWNRRINYVCLTHPCKLKGLLFIFKGKPIISQANVSYYGKARKARILLL